MSTPGNFPFLPVLDVTQLAEPITLSGNSFSGLIFAGKGMLTTVLATNNGATAVASGAFFDSYQSGAGQQLVGLKIPGGGNQVIAAGVPGIWFKNGLFYLSQGGSLFFSLTLIPYRDKLS